MFMLIIDLNINGIHQATEIKVIRKQPHTKLPHHFWYSFTAKDDNGGRWSGRVLHNYNQGAIALTQKVTKAIVAQQRRTK